MTIRLNDLDTVGTLSAVCSNLTAMIRLLVFLVLHGPEARVAAELVAKRRITVHWRNDIGGVPKPE